MGRQVDKQIKKKKQKGQTDTYVSNYSASGILGMKEDVGEG